MNGELVREEYEKNQSFKQWLDAYYTYKGISFDAALTNPTVIYSAKYWKGQREEGKV